VAQTLRSYTGPNTTRLVLDLSRTTTFKVETDSSRKTFSVLVPSGLESPSFGRPVLDDGAVTGIDAGETTDGFRLTVHMVEWNPPRVFGLDGDAGQAARVVVDVVRPGQAERDAQERARVDRLTASAKRIVVVDPGHGGEAVGAIGPKRTYEKDVTLAIAKRLKEELEKTPGVTVVLTRTGDYDVPLRERYRVAERYAADAFVSIHCNSTKRGNSGSGTEVYFLSMSSASDEASKALADVENAADKISAGPAANERRRRVGRHPVRPQADRVAAAVVGPGRGDPGRGRERSTPRGARRTPGGFAVLKSPIVPSVLVETAFINNPAEERLLRDPGFSRRWASRSPAASPPTSRARPSWRATTAPASSRSRPPRTSVSPASPFWARFRR
jgi:N-acetylmuramoyl-L-alanine amidase